MQDLTAFQRDMLYVVAGLDEPYGLEIKGKMEEYYDVEVNHGRLYPNLDILAERDLLKKGKHDERTNEYEVTEKGRRFLDQRSAWEQQHHQPAAPAQGD
ncbi:PadR family transcriptional regulator [Halobacterium sp. KA-4]|uniref:helix-turn-helix transcriptional regulator n=1 Tax=Halobacterium sp. KA-4 TaxID=2896367 RepID=UPI001E38D36F|nr:helix-turn-helix transcriptional regulator [Halobacterium sp. KA-4]MCD2200948.1 PadR family transcriptional regulator [Halobacterium sp. KA-4]